MFADLGIICAGGITNGVYPTDAPDQVEYLINDSGSAAFILPRTRNNWTRCWRCAQRTPSTGEGHHLRHGRPAVRWTIRPVHQLRSTCWNWAKAYDSGKPWRLWEEAIEAVRMPEDVMILTYTSGTTGRPKGAMISHRNILFQVQSLHQRDPAVLGPEGRAGGFSCRWRTLPADLFYTYFAVIESCSAP